MNQQNSFLDSKAIPIGGGILGALIGSLVGFGPVGGFAGYGAGYAANDSLKGLLGYQQPSSGQALNEALTGSAMSAYGGEALNGVMSMLPRTYLKSKVKSYIPPEYQKVELPTQQPSISTPKQQEVMPKIEGETFYHGTSKAGAENINKNGFIVTTGGRNKGMGISVSSDLNSASRFASTKGQPFQRRAEPGGVFELKISPDANKVSSDYFIQVRNNLAEKFKSEGMSINDAYSKAQTSAIEQLKKIGVDIIDFRNSLAQYGGEEELRILNPKVILSKNLMSQSSFIPEVVGIKPSIFNSDIISNEQVNYQNKLNNFFKKR